MGRLRWLVMSLCADVTGEEPDHEMYWLPSAPLSHCAHCASGDIETELVVAVWPCIIVVEL